MSTGGSIGIILKGEYKGLLNYSDSYPGGLGEDVVAFVKKLNKTKTGWARLKRNFAKVIAVDRDTPPTSEQIERYEGYADLSVNTGLLSDWYCLLRKIQGVGMLIEILKGKLGHAVFLNDFIKDSLMCEYAYVINLDNMTIEFYGGFQTKPQEGNRFGTEPREKDEGNEEQYFPCKMVGSCKLNRIPVMWAEKFYPQDPDEE